jgi:small subunit ribosomal protein S8
MSFQDPIADMLTRVRNAYSAGKESVQMPHSNQKQALAGILKQQGYIKDFNAEVQDGKRALRLFLKYSADDEPIIQGLKRISKPSLRRYEKAKDLPRVLGGLGVAIVSTSAGILTDREARRRNIGGEVLCYVW